MYGTLPVCHNTVYFYMQLFIYICFWSPFQFEGWPQQKDLLSSLLCLKFGFSLPNSHHPLSNHVNLISIGLLSFLTFVSLFCWQFGLPRNFSTYPNNLIFLVLIFLCQWGVYPATFVFFLNFTLDKQQQQPPPHTHTTHCIYRTHRFSVGRWVHYELNPGLQKRPPLACGVDFPSLLYLAQCTPLVPFTSVNCHIY